MSDESDSFFGYVSGELGENVTLGCYQETEYKEISTICNAVAFRGIGEETPLTTERTKEGYEVINTESLVPGVYRMYVFYNLGGTGGSESHYYAFRIVD